MAVADVGSLETGMAVDSGGGKASSSARVEWSTQPQPGMVKCDAPGCPNYFKRASGRHLYCKAPGCTFKRGAPPERPVELPSVESAAYELLRRLQDEDEAEVGPSVLVQRVQQVQRAMRAGDTEAQFGALIDVGTCCVWWADRARRGEVPRLVPEPARPQQPAPSPVGMVQAVVASHRRTFALAERRVELLWAVVGKRDALAAARVAGAGVQEAERALELAERALTSVEGAWRERGRTLEELQAAAGPRVAVG